MTQTLQIRQIRWIDPASGHDAVVDLNIRDGRPGIAQSLDPQQPCIDGEGLWLMPGMIDLQHNLLASGEIQGADMGSELEAAYRCGLALVCAAPDSSPSIENSASIEWIEQHAPSHNAARPLLLGALTQQLAGAQLSNMAALQKAGCIGLSQGSAPLPPVDLLRQCMRYAADLDLTLFLAPQWPDLNQGCVHDGITATALGLPGIPTAAESVAVAVLLTLIEDTGCRVHLGPLSSAAGAQAFAAAKQRGLPVSADTTLWHLGYDESCIAGYNPHFHLQPPLRETQDRDTLRSLVAQGVIEAISTGHQPLSLDAKFAPFAETRIGANGIDGLMAQLLQLVQEKLLTPLQLAERVASGPARIVNAKTALGTSWMLIDPAHAWTLTDEQFQSASRNSPLSGATLRGAVAGWIENGEPALFGDWRGRLGV